MSRRAKRAATSGGSRGPERSLDLDLLPVFIVVWLGSAVRVILALAQRERFGAEATLAFLFLVLLPWAMAPSAFRWVATIVRGSGDPEENDPDSDVGAAASKASKATIVSLVPRIASRRARP